MAFFKFRKGGDDHPTPAQAPESAPAMRKRARQRLIGAAVLVLIGVVGFPLLFDNQPRPVAVDIPIEIPDKAKVKPLTAVQEAAPKVQTPVAAVASAPVATAPAPAPKEEVIIPSAVAPVALAPKPVVDKVVEKPADKPVAKVDTAAEKRPAASAAAAAGRFIVQVGAFAEVLKAREARVKLEKAGLKTYTQVVQTADGKRIRVRVGPFESHAEADKAAAKIKKLDLPAAILEL